MSTINNFFAILNDESVRAVYLTQDIIPNIQQIFVFGGLDIVNDGIEEIKFTGDYRIDEDEVLFVEMAIPDLIINAVKNPLGVHPLHILQDDVKTLFWFEAGVFYFQNFDKRRLLQNKNVLFFSTDTYDKLKADAFIVEEYVNALHKDGKFYFKSFANANKIFNLGEFYHEATNDEIRHFAKNDKVTINEDWFTSKTNTVIRKQITLILKSDLLKSADTHKIQSAAALYKLNVELDPDGKIKFPNDAKVCKNILSFLNEQYFTGAISGQQFRANSKRPIS